MVYLYEAGDQISDFYHQQLEKCDEKYLGRTEGETDRGKTVYPPPPSGSGGIITNTHDSDMIQKETFCF
jgi:hypothetical protein